MRRNDIGAILIIAALYAGMQLMGITCPILFMTGVSCAGCGMSRAWLALLRLDISSAFAYHPLFWLPVPGAAVLLLRRHIPKNVLRLILVVIVTLFLAVYVVRLLTPGDNIVVFSPSQGLLLRLLSRLRS